jgi:hypothetical protein
VVETLSALLLGASVTFFSFESDYFVLSSTRFLEPCLATFFLAAAFGFPYNDPNFSTASRSDLERSLFYTNPYFNFNLNSSILFYSYFFYLINLFLKLYLRMKTAILILAVSRK